ncbi:MAG: HAD-IIIA family hydrolase [Thermaurantimonas sp.]|uniref:HAD-IIIA family hydrolase n=1 Tax=Thermaurantimonas sp. TaxID=2681568 RepID=UPI00391A80B7
MVTDAYILCGGKGTRMGQLASNLPKPMLPLMGKPVLEHIVLQCVKNGIKRICLITGHLSHVIEEYFKDGNAWNVEIRYFKEAEPLGTTGAFKLLESELPDIFWIFYGDVVFDMDLKRMYNFHKAKNARMTIAVHPNDHPYDSDLIETDLSDRVVQVHPKPHAADLRVRNLVNAALYLVEKEVIHHIPIGKSDWGRHQLPKLCKTLPIYAWRTAEYLKDMGTPDRIQKVEADLKSGKPQRRNLQQKQKAIFLDRDGVLNEDIDLIHQPEQLKVFPFAAEAVRKINQSDYLAIVVTNQSVVARGLTDEAGLNRIHAELDYQLAEGYAYLDDLYYCPHHPDKGFEGEVVELKIECECRKPKPGMLLKAAERYNIDLNGSWIIGDRQADVEAGLSAGCTTMGVMTGNGLKNTRIAPDFTFYSVAEAVEYILKEPHKPVAESLLQRIRTSSKRPYVLAIAGNTGTGKSTLATYVQRYFLRNGINVLKVELDHWILASEKRSSAHDLHEIYQINRLEEDLKNFLEGKSVTPTGYQRNPTWKIEPPKYKLTSETDVVIVEGIVALMLKNLVDKYDWKLFCTVSDKTFYRNLYQLNRWKGRTDEEIKQMIQLRKSSEYNVIAEQGTLADEVIWNDAI